MAYASRMRKPFPTYIGSKDAGGVVERIAGLFQPHSVYVECCLGNGAVLRRKSPALRTIGIDKDPRVIAAWRELGWPGLELVRADAIKWLRHAAAWLPADALVYADPPYVLSTRGHRRYYRCELSDAEHSELLDVLDALPCSVFVSGYECSLYRRRLTTWSHESFPAQTRGGTRIEHVWYRRSIIARFGEEARYAGRDFRERERIKRKAHRWASRYLTMPPAERSAVLGACLSAEASARVTARTRRPAHPACS